MIEIVSHNHASELISLSGGYLEQSESENNRPLGYVYKLAEDPHAYDSEPPLLLSVLEHGKAIGVAMVIPPYGSIILSRIGTKVETAVVQLVRYLREIDVQISGIIGPAAEAQAFSDCWVEGMLDVSARISMRLRIFEARSVANLPLSPGKF